MPVNMDKTLQLIGRELSAASEQLVAASTTLQTEITNVVTAVGANLTNLTNPIVEAATSTLGKLGENLSIAWNEILGEKFQMVTEGLINLWQEINPIFLNDMYGFISSLWNTLLISTLSALSMFIQNTISFSLNEQLMPFIMKTLNTTLSALTIFIQENVSAVLHDQLTPYIQETIQTAVYELKELIGETFILVKETITAIWGETVRPIYDEAKRIFYETKDEIIKKFEPIEKLIKTFNEYLDKDWAELKRLLNETVTEILDTVKTSTLKFAKDFYMDARGSLSKIVNIIGLAVQAFITYLGYKEFGLLGGIAGWFGGDYVKNKLIEAFKDIDQEIVENLEKETQNSGNLGKVQGLTMPYRLAEGGIPGYGELFVAREAGPEFVGSFGSRNVVMNNDQIVAAVSGGVYNAVRRATAEQTQQPIYLNVEAKVRENVLFDMMETVKAERGVRLATGGVW